MPGMKATMDEFKSGELRSGSKAGPVVKNRSQAIAIGLNERRRAGEAVPTPKGLKRQLVSANLLRAGRGR